MYWTGIVLLHGKILTLLLFLGERCGDECNCRGPSSFIPPSEVSKPTLALTVIVDSAYLHAGFPRQRMGPSNKNYASYYLDSAHSCVTVYYHNLAVKA